MAKVVYAIHHLRGRAFVCFLPETQDFLNEEQKEKKKETKALFASFEYFVERLELFFEDSRREK